MFDYIFSHYETSVFVIIAGGLLVWSMIDLAIVSHIRRKESEETVKAMRAELDIPQHKNVIYM